jgi:DnaJ-class molecular chaperone
MLEIKKAYRRLAVTLHPDKLQLGTGDDKVFHVCPSFYDLIIVQSRTEFCSISEGL